MFKNPSNIGRWQEDWFKCCLLKKKKKFENIKRVIKSHKSKGRQLLKEKRLKRQTMVDKRLHRK